MLRQVTHYYCDDCGRDQGAELKVAEAHERKCSQRNQKLAIGDRVYSLIKGADPKMKVFGTLVSIGLEELIVTRAGQRGQRTPIDRKQFGFVFFVDPDQARAALVRYKESEEFRKHNIKPEHLFETQLNK